MPAITSLDVSAIDSEKPAQLDTVTEHTTPPENDTKYIHRLLNWGVETRGWFYMSTTYMQCLTFFLKGIAPVPLKEKTDVAFSRMFTFWFTISVNILP
jgi:hypothetical protein